MAPENKEKVLSVLNNLKMTTLMCGDGANDVESFFLVFCFLVFFSFPAPFFHQLRGGGVVVCGGVCSVCAVKSGLQPVGHGSAHAALPGLLSGLT